MKKLGLFLLSVLIMHSAVAYDTAKLKMTIQGGNDARYFLCVSNSGGCNSILAAKRGKIFPIDVGTVSYIFPANTHLAKMYPQTLPDSCKVTVNKDQTLEIKGTLEVTTSHTQIKNLQCTIT